MKQSKFRRILGFLGVLLLAGVLLFSVLFPFLFSKKRLTVSAAESGVLLTHGYVPCLLSLKKDIFPITFSCVSDSGFSVTNAGAAVCYVSLFSDSALSSPIYACFEQPQNFSSSVKNYSIGRQFLSWFGGTVGEGSSVSPVTWNASYSIQTGAAGTSDIPVEPPTYEGGYEGVIQGGDHPGAALIWSSTDVYISPNASTFLNTLFDTSYAAPGSTGGGSGGASDEQLQAKYDEGYAAGYNMGQSEQLVNPLSYFIAPVQTFLDTKLFGVVSIGTVLNVALFVSIALIFIKMFAGG